MKRKLVIILMLMIGSAMAAVAQEFTTLVIQMKDGSSTKVQMLQQPKITFSGDTLIIKTMGTKLEIPRSKVKRFNYIDESGVDGVKTSAAKFSQHGDRLIFTGLPTGSLIAVYGIDGRLMREAEAAGSYEISLSELAAGIYVVSVNGASTKITIRR
ncbi:MAG: T9SS type A sorting domain-containing protein [Muribaculaceae bacterium]|jgi:hypothetical protein|nr:T9SS type A sorting domain-containing protein [Muribaculaceae bacterium]